MDVRIYQPSKNAMQSGRGKTAYWLIEYELETARRPETLMGWVGSGDTNNQVRLKFSTLEEAQAFAKKEGWRYSVLPSHQKRVKPRNYADNFKYTPPAGTPVKVETKAEPVKASPAAKALPPSLLLKKLP